MRSSYWVALVAALLLSVAGVGCGDSEEGTTGGTDSGSDAGGDGGGDRGNIPVCGDNEVNGSEVCDGSASVSGCSVWLRLMWRTVANSPICAASSAVRARAMPLRARV